MRVHSMLLACAYAVAIVALVATAEGIVGWRDAKMKTSAMAGTMGVSAMAVCSASGRAASGNSHSVASWLSSQATKPWARPRAAKSAIAGASTIKS